MPRPLIARQWVKQIIMANQLLWWVALGIPAKRQTVHVSKAVPTTAALLTIVTYLCLYEIAICMCLNT